MIEDIIQFPIIDLSSSAYGHRICFGECPINVNPRNELGKFGIKAHNKFTRLFHKTIALANYRDTEKTYYLNKKSTVKWIRSLTHDDTVSKHSTNDAIIAKIVEILENPPSQSDYKRPSINTQTLSRVNKLRGHFWQGFFNFTAKTWTLFKARFFVFRPSERTLKTASETTAVAQFFVARKTVPDYLEFLDTSVEEHPRKFFEIPITSKENYIKPSMESDDHGRGLYKGNVIPSGSRNDTSTGTSGVPTQWYRGRKEQETVKVLSSYAARAILGDRPYYFINGFALGQWASGLTAFAATNNDPNAIVSSPGMDDVHKIYNAIKQAINLMEPDYPIVVAGYPPHLREVVELAIQEDFDLSSHNIIGVVGGEGISEGQRALIVAQKDENLDILREGFRHCYSTYGASDLDINIGYESEFEIELRKLCHENAELAAELFDGKSTIPMIFHYDPLNYHIETNEEDHLIFTCARDDRISPRIRYDLGDIGKVMSCSDVVATLKKHGITLDNMPRTHLPLVFVWGRGDSMITYRGANLVPENLGEAIRRADLYEAIAHYAFFQYEEDGRTVTEFMIEPHAEANIPEDLLEILIHGLKEINPDFEKQYDNCHEAIDKPKLRLFDPGESPMALQRARYPHAKKKYIFVENPHDEFTPNHFDLNGLLREDAN